MTIEESRLIQSDQLLDPKRDAFLFRSPYHDNGTGKLLYRREFGEGTAEIFHPFQGCAVILCDGRVDNPDALSNLGFQVDIRGLNIVVLGEEGDTSFRTDAGLKSVTKDQSLIFQASDTYERTTDIIWNKENHKYALFLFNSEASKHECGQLGVLPPLLSPKLGDKGGKTRKHFHFERSASIDALSKSLWACDLKPHQKSNFVSLKVKELFLLLDRIIPAPDFVRDPLYRSKLNKIYTVRTKIDENIANPPSLDELATMAGLCRSLLSEQFHEVQGVTLQDYILEQRLQIARNSLVSSDSTISEIATQCGYNHVANFSRAFKRRYGLSPKTYRGARH